ncbi:hypothetical protein [Chryseobacterium fistulae]|uniref:N-acetyltransferase domain-containing protein n=1 Tax=Chryseobacterium fistulae TaxID=2675058 RepID=A0A6N4XYP9_9FLAO|nr:hypothetical protein [Chryseobacterium fistulae]CAA7390351.1 hypothetical protein CHRY9393_02655 [Chryseobacterium fistulae]
MIIKRTDSSDTDFRYLVELLDADLAIRNGEDHAFYNQFNGILETSLEQNEALSVYEKSGYKRISNYGQYRDVESSVCYEKELK